MSTPVNWTSNKTFMLVIGPHKQKRYCCHTISHKCITALSRPLAVFGRGEERKGAGEMGRGGRAGKGGEKKVKISYWQLFFQFRAQSLGDQV